MTKRSITSISSKLGKGSKSLLMKESAEKSDLSQVFILSDCRYPFFGMSVYSDLFYTGDSELHFDR